jgi:beta-lactamase superfamily II metal-dependent hydrolase
MKKFSIEMLPAREGDCLWIEYGDSSNPNRLLIDGGKSETYQEIRRKIAELKKPMVRFELLIVSHVDADHIEGIIDLLRDPKVAVDEVWFNGYRHLPGALEEYGPVQGELVSATIDEKEIPWNETKFGGDRISIPQEGDLPTISLKGDMKLTLLSPYVKQLAKLKPVWQKACQDAGIDPSQPKTEPTRKEVEGVKSYETLDVEALAAKKFDGDTSEANGSSIAVLAEYDEKRALLAGDAYPTKLAESITKLVGSQKGKLKLDAFKVPHHGSKHNINQKLLQKIDCKRYLLSTDGTIHEHPDREAIARIIKFGGPKAQLIFNYKTDFNKVWNQKHLRQKYDYSTIFPSSKQKGKIVSLET